jgi:hypothetical protein
VDDGVIVTNKESIAEEFIEEIKKYLKKVTLSNDFVRYLGMDINYLPGGYILLSQEIYIEGHFDEYNKIQSTPMSNTTNLRIQPPNISNASLLPVTGALRYPADRCRPDILVAVGEMSTGGSPHPSDEHVKTSVRCRNYLTTTKSLGMLFGGPAEFNMFAYTDASYITDGNARSRLGGCLFLSLYSGAILSYSKNDTTISTISHSSTEAEIKSIDEMAREIIHQREVAVFCGLTVNKPTPMYVDTKSSIELCSTLKERHKTRHINMRICFIRELVQNKIISFHFVVSEDNVADMLTKPLYEERFEAHRDKLMTGHKGIAPTAVPMPEEVTAERW